MGARSNFRPAVSQLGGPLKENMTNPFLPNTEIRRSFILWLLQLVTENLKYSQHVFMFVISNL